MSDVAFLSWGVFVGGTVYVDDFAWSWGGYACCFSLEEVAAAPAGVC